MGEKVGALGWGGWQCRGVAAGSGEMGRVGGEVEGSDPLVGSRRPAKK